MKLDICNYTLEELKKYLEQNNFKGFHSKQIFKWIWKENKKEFDDMTDISKNLREFLKENSYFPLLKIEKEYISKDGTKKFLIKLEDGNIIEAVLMKYNYGNTLCVSTQIGCKMGCKFCASTGIGFVRDLKASEIAFQIKVVEEYTKEKVANVVYMGIGEPLDNYENVVRSIKIINERCGMEIGARHISISTCGLVDKIYNLADEQIPCTLSISLHATTDEKRKKIMPIANKFSIQEIIKACRYYVEKTKRRISFEYALINGENDSLEDAKKLFEIIRGTLAHINLIPVNKIKNGIYQEPKENNIRVFIDYLNKKGIVTTVRRKCGDDINAACGQLRRSEIENKDEKNN